VAVGNFIPGRIHDQYETAVPFKVMLGTLGIAVLLGALFYCGALALLFGVSWYYARVAFGEERIPDWAGMPAAYYRDALWIGLGGAATLAGMQTVLLAASRHFATVHRSAEASFGTDFDAFVPIGSIFGGSLLHSLLFTGVVALVASFVVAEVRSLGTRFLLFVLGTLALVGSNWGNPADLALQFVARAIFLAVVVFGIARIIRFNMLGCFLVLATIALANGAAELLGQADRFYRANGYGLLVVLLGLLAWPVLVWRMRSSSTLTSPKQTG
jgi:hypothetical protein